MEMSLLYLVFYMFIGKSISSGDLSGKLHYFETLKVSDIHHRTRRSPDDLNPHAHLKEVRFSGFGRQFLLYLRPNDDVLSSDFVVYVESSDGSKSELSVDKAQFFSGNLAGDESSKVIAYWEDRDLMATIYSGVETYVIEPSWRHLPESTNHSMILYRGSDVKSYSDYNDVQRQPVCGYVRPDDEQNPSYHLNDFDESSVPEYSDSHHSEHRTKRDLYKDSKICQLFVVADYLFHKGIGGGYLHRTANYLINIINRVNSIYQDVDWDGIGQMKHFGFEIKEIRIHQNFTPIKDLKKPHFNNDLGKWETKKLLDAFSRNSDFDRFCLAHLFTYQSFEKGVLGLAYIASPRHNTVGGICSRSYYRGRDKYFLNTGWSSSMNTNGDRILSLEADLVTSHELGHNWGSEHDPENDNCAPSSYKNGKYLMYPYAVGGLEINNKKFSPCSKNFVAAVLKAKAYSCFTESKGYNYCGNSKIDHNEECDAGFLGINDQDECCTKNCRFRLNATCSPMNHVCCVGCKMAGEKYLCRQEQENDGTCDGDAYCSGASFECGRPEKKDNGKKCLDEGECLNGKCMSYCDQRGEEPCQCLEYENSCKRCCRVPGQDECKVYDDPLPDNRPCYQGYCTTGVCHKTKQDMVERLFSIIENITPDQLVAFMRSNIVGTVIIFSLIVWIPASCFFTYLDKKNERKDAQMRKWLSRDNRNLFVDTDPKIRRVDRPHHAIGSVVRNPRMNLFNIQNDVARLPGAESTV